MGNEDNDLFEDPEVVRAEKERIKKQLFEASEEIWSPLTANNIMHEMYHELEKAGVENPRRGDIATAVAHARYLGFRAFIELRTARQGVMRCTEVDDVEKITKLNNESREELDSIMDNWASRWEPYYSDKEWDHIFKFFELKDNREEDAVKKVLSGLKDILLEYKAKLDDKILQYELSTKDIKTPSIVESPKEYIALTDEILNSIETEYKEVISAVQSLSKIDMGSYVEDEFSFTAYEDSFTRAVDFETKMIIGKITPFIEESKKVVSSCREECMRILESGTANVSNASAGTSQESTSVDSDTFKYEIKRLKEEDNSIRTEISKRYKELHEYVETLFQGARGMSDVAENVDRQDKIIRNLNERIEKLEQAQQPPANSSINEKLDVLSRKVKELESKFGNLKKVVYDVINKGNSSAVEELGIGNVEEVEFTNSESSAQEDDSKSNRLNDAFADLDKQLADLQEIFNA